jgi:hypothetical protein
MHRPSGPRAQAGRAPPVRHHVGRDEILDHWAHPGRAEETLGKQILIKWWLLRVSGPLPGRPADRGEFVMQVSFYGDPPGWWITAG